MSESPQPSPGSDSQEQRVEEAQAMALAAETARHLAEEKNLELSHLVTESSQQIALLQGQVKALQAELRQARDELSPSPESEGDVSRAAFLRLQQQLSQLHATSKLKLEKMADDSRQRHQLWEQAQQRASTLEMDLARQRKQGEFELAGLRQQLQGERLLRGQQAEDSNRVRELELQVKKQEKDLLALRGELEDYQLALETNEDQIRFVEEELEDREEIIDSLQAQLAAYLDKLRLAQGKLNSVGEAVQQRNTWLRQLQEQNRGLTAKCRSWEQLHEQANQHKVQLEAELQKAGLQKEDVFWELEETQASLEDSQNMVSNLQEQLIQLMPQARQQINELQAKIKSLEERIRQESSEETRTDLKAVPEFKEDHLV